MIKDINLAVELMTDKRSLPASDVEEMWWQQLQKSRTGDGVRDLCPSIYLHPSQQLSSSILLFC